MDRGPTVDYRTNASTQQLLDIFEGNKTVKAAFHVSTRTHPLTLLLCTPVLDSFANHHGLDTIFLTLLFLNEFAQCIHQLWLTRNVSWPENSDALNKLIEVLAASEADLYTVYTTCSEQGLLGWRCQRLARKVAVALGEWITEDESILESRCVADHHAMC